MNILQSLSVKPVNSMTLLNHRVNGQSKQLPKDNSVK